MTSPNLPSSSPLSYPTASTPVPSVHYTPPRTPSPSPIKGGVLGQAIVDEILGQTAIALSNVDILGTKPFAFLRQWGQNLENTANGLLGNLYGTGTTTVPSSPSIQHAALPSTYAVINADLQNLFNDVVFASGRGWQDIGTDVQQFVDDLVGTGHTVTVNAPSQVPNTAIGSTVSGGTSLGQDVQSANGSASSATDLASSASDTAAQAASQVHQLLTNAPAAPTGLVATGSIVTGITGVVPWLETAYYRVSAINAASVESAPSGEVSAFAWLTPMEVKLTWNAVTGASSYRVYRGTAAGNETQYATVTTNSFTDTGA